MNRRFPNYQPSTALRQAIEALNAARKNREADGKRAAELPGQGQGGPDVLASTPGQEGTSTGEGQSQADALMSGRKNDDS